MAKFEEIQIFEFLRAAAERRQRTRNPLVGLPGVVEAPGSHRGVVAQPLQRGLSAAARIEMGHLQDLNTAGFLWLKCSVADSVFLGHPDPDP